MDATTVLILVGAGILGGAANAIAGGGTFFTFPALIATGLDPLTANVSNAVAIYPGHAAAVPAYRHELRALGPQLAGRGLIAALGGLVGAGLLIWSGEAVFSGLVPWLLLLAPLIFWASGYLHRLTTRIRANGPVVTLPIQFLFALYGGYFGAGLGVLLMATLALIGVQDVQSANAQKNLLATLITTISVGLFVTAGMVAWPETITVLVRAIIGGYFGAWFARRIPANILRYGIVAIGFGLSIYYFLACGVR